MIKICPICGEQFETHDRRKKYCSTECARHAKISQNNNWNKGEREEKRLKWVHEEAYKIYELALEENAYGMDDLVDYIYNNYNKRSKER